MRNPRSGFSLTELLVATAIAGIFIAFVAYLSVELYRNYSFQQKTVELQTDLRSLRTIINDEISRTVKTLMEDAGQNATVFGTSPFNQNRYIGFSGVHFIKAKLPGVEPENVTSNGVLLIQYLDQNPRPLATAMRNPTQLNGDEIRIPASQITALTFSQNSIYIAENGAYNFLFQPSGVTPGDPVGVTVSDNFVTQTLLSGPEAQITISPVEFTALVHDHSTNQLVRVGPLDVNWVNAVSPNPLTPTANSVISVDFSSQGSVITPLASNIDTFTIKAFPCAGAADPRSFDSSGLDDDCQSSATGAQFNQAQQYLVQLSARQKVPGGKFAVATLAFTTASVRVSPDFNGNVLFDGTSEASSLCELCGPTGCTPNCNLIESDPGQCPDLTPDDLQYCSCWQIFSGYVGVGEPTGDAAWDSAGLGQNVYECCAGDPCSPECKMAMEFLFPVSGDGSGGVCQLPGTMGDCCSGCQDPTLKCSCPDGTLTLNEQCLYCSTNPDGTLNAEVAAACCDPDEGFGPCSENCPCGAPLKSTCTEIKKLCTQCHDDPLLADQWCCHPSADSWQKCDYDYCPRACDLSICNDTGCQFWAHDQAKVDACEAMTTMYSSGPFVGQTNRNVICQRCTDKADPVGSNAYLRAPNCARCTSTMGGGGPPGSGVPLSVLTSCCEAQYANFCGTGAIPTGWDPASPPPELACNLIYFENHFDSNGNGTAEPAELALAKAEYCKTSCGFCNPQQCYDPSPGAPLGPPANVCTKCLDAVPNWTLGGGYGFRGNTFLPGACNSATNPPIGYMCPNWAGTCGSVMGGNALYSSVPPPGVDAPAPVGDGCSNGTTELTNLCTIRGYNGDINLTGPIGDSAKSALECLSTHTSNFTQDDRERYLCDLCDTVPGVPIAQVCEACRRVNTASGFYKNNDVGRSDCYGPPACLNKTPPNPQCLCDVTDKAAQCACSVPAASSPCLCEATDANVKLYRKCFELGCLGKDAECDPCNPALLASYAQNFGCAPGDTSSFCWFFGQKALCEAGCSERCCEFWWSPWNMFFGNTLLPLHCTGCTSASIGGPSGKSDQCGEFCEDPTKYCVNPSLCENLTNQQVCTQCLNQPGADGAQAMKACCNYISSAGATTCPPLDPDGGGPIQPDPDNSQYCNALSSVCPLAVTGICGNLGAPSINAACHCYNVLATPAGICDPVCQKDESILCLYCGLQLMDPDGGGPAAPVCPNAPNAQAECPLCYCCVPSMVNQATFNGFGCFTSSCGEVSGGSGGI